MRIIKPKTGDKVTETKKIEELIGQVNSLTERVDEMESMEGWLNKWGRTIDVRLSALENDSTAEAMKPEEVLERANATYGKASEFRRRDSDGRISGIDTYPTSEEVNWESVDIKYPTENYALLMALDVINENLHKALHPTKEEK